MSEVVQPKPKRPVHRNIHIFQIMQYRLPAAGLISILHRVSGLLLFLALPFLLYLFEKSLVSEISFETFRETVAGPVVKLALLALVWAYLHHFCAGIRHLFMDLHMGLEKTQGRNTALAVFVVSIPLALLVGAKLFGVF